MPSRSWQTNPVDGKWRRTRLLVLQRDGWRCQIKGPNCTFKAEEVDHVLGRGVSEELGDLRAACRACNGGYRPPSDPLPRPATNW